MADDPAQRRRRYAEVLEAHGPGLARVVGTYARTDEEREDLRQEFALALWKALPAFRSEASLKTFAYRIASNLSISALRRQRESVPAGEFAAPSLSPEQALANADRAGQLRTAIHALPLSLRQVVMLRLEDLSYAEIASILGLSEGNVSVRLTRARKQLRQRLENAP